MTDQQLLTAQIQANTRAVNRLIDRIDSFFGELIEHDIRLARLEELTRDS